MCRGKKICSSPDLAKEFNDSFQDFAAIDKDLLLFTSPFILNSDEAPEELQQGLIELQCDNECRSR